MEVENRGYKCGYFWQKWGGFRTLGSGHTACYAICSFFASLFVASKTKDRYSVRFYRIKCKQKSDEIFCFCEIEMDLKCSDVKWCSIENWYAKFRKVTFKTIILAIPNEVIDYLRVRFTFFLTFLEF